MTIEWDEKFDMGVPEIDSAHRTFVTIINKLLKATSDDADKYYTQRLISELVKYAEFHFISEENVMIEHSYPDLVKHQNLHQNLLTEMNNLIFAFDIGAKSQQKVIEFVIRWFKKHTATVDQEFAGFLKQKRKVHKN